MNLAPVRPLAVEGTILFVQVLRRLLEPSLRRVAGYHGMDQPVEVLRTCAFIPKYRSFPCIVRRIAGSGALAPFCAAMIVASTIVPDFSSSYFCRAGANRHYPLACS
jgi:hypothetical protein